MKVARIAIWAWAGWMTWGGLAHAKPAARDALQVLETAAGAQVVTQVVALVGFHGDDQPPTWRLLVKDEANPEILREYAVTEGKLTGPKELRREDYEDMPDKPLLSVAWRVDSTEAYRIADDEAILAGISFSKLNYQLRFRGGDSAPTWLLTFVDAAGGEVGQVVIDASDKSIPYRNFPSEASLAQPVPSEPVLSPVMAPPAPVEASVNVPADPVYSSRPVRLRNLFSGARGKRGERTR